jgi:hypothetical protein
MVLKAGDTLKLRGTALKFYHHAGDTPGVLSAEFSIKGLSHKAPWQRRRRILRRIRASLDDDEPARADAGHRGVGMIHSWAGPGG